ncbi:2-aminoethanethiol dioxygenase [Musa troglodytarum]|uniref:cysteine dioxygenase n=1 Tax=Musa troglodytarum TaxID=320322 RepID=A0A9E7KBC7_9LILI|nr:2-aminoethanethiol dioxygenase [Musa troglodytarum]
MVSRRSSDFQRRRAAPKLGAATPNDRRFDGIPPSPLQQVEVGPHFDRVMRVLTRLPNITRGGSSCDHQSSHRIALQMVDWDMTFFVPVLGEGCLGKEGKPRTWAESRSEDWKTSGMVKSPSLRQPLGLLFSRHVAESGFLLRGPPVLLSPSHVYMSAPCLSSPLAKILYIFSAAILVLRLIAPSTAFSHFSSDIRSSEPIKLESWGGRGVGVEVLSAKNCVLDRVSAARMKVQVEARNGEEGKRAAGAKRNAGRLVRKRGYSRRTRRRVQATSTAIQRLFLACKTVFKGPGTVPEPADVQMLQLLLDKMRPEDVGLSTEILFFKAQSSSEGARITYSTIYKCRNFSMCIFFLPPSAVIPLHDHPGMTVFSKLLLGSMHIKSYDWLDSTPSANLRPAKLVVDSDFTAPCDTSILYPTTGGNIHSFTAITPCAVLDVLGPPYSREEEDRDITYYRDYPDGAIVENGGKDHCLGWLEVIDISEDLKMDGVEYLGPQVIDG